MQAQHNIKFDTIGELRSKELLYRSFIYKRKCKYKQRYICNEENLYFNGAFYLLAIERIYYLETFKYENANFTIEKELSKYKYTVKNTILV